jgi:hypothetical protein
MIIKPRNVLGKGAEAFCAPIKTEKKTHFLQVFRGFAAKTAFFDKKSKIASFMKHLLNTPRSFSTNTYQLSLN